MKSEQLNTILLLILVYLIIKKDKTANTKTFVMNGEGKTIGELGTTF